jgi:hypothetical protein
MLSISFYRYSHDAYQFNQRSRLNEKRDYSDDHLDILAKQYPTYNRGRVWVEVMHERGFEDCDYISIEEFF